MVKKLEEKEDKFYHEGARSIILGTETLLDEIGDGELKGTRIVRCSVNKHEDKIAYALAREKRILGYFIVKPVEICGFVGMQACRGWICPELRGKGVYPKLRSYAQNGSPLISDPEGMTEKAFKSWVKEKNQKVCCFERGSAEYREIGDVPETELFCTGKLENKWSLVLKPS
jgi:hypothetical protein